MITATLSKFTDLIEGLSLEKPLVLYGVSWAHFEEILRETGDSKSVKLTYDKGVLEIQMPNFDHEGFADWVKRLVDRVGTTMRKEIIFSGSTTFSKSGVEKSAQPDASFYIRESDTVRGKKKIDLDFDIAPDIVVEIDISSSSIEKFEIYAAFGVPEFWLYSKKALKIYHLQENKKYAEVSASIELPILTAKILTRYINRSQTENQFDVLSDFENWLNENK